MPLFGRRAARTGGAPSAAPVERIGRKFSSTAGIEKCVEDFRAAVAQQMGVAPSFFDARWAGPRPAPERVLGVASGPPAAPGEAPPGAMYLALWADGLMYFVVPDYAARPTPPLVEAWKARDESLCSVGGVHSDEFAVAEGARTPASRPNPGPDSHPTAGWTPASSPDPTSASAPGSTSASAPDSTTAPDADSWSPAGQFSMRDMSS